MTEESVREVEPSPARGILHRQYAGGHVLPDADDPFHSAELVPEPTIPRLARRIAAGIQSLMTGLTAYLEDGVSPEA